VVRRTEGGFTLVEAIIALTLSSVLVVLVSTVFLVQNQYYALQLERSATQDNARVVTETVASEIRSIMEGGVVLAQNKRLVVRSPIVLGVVCAHSSGSRVAVQIRGGDANLDTDEVSGVALRDSLTGTWNYRDAGWSSMHQTSGSPAADCAANGADTVGATGDYHRFRRFNTFFGGLPALGSVVMFYRNVEYEFDTSEMDVTTTALFRGMYGDDLVEFATGMDASAGFQYRTGGSTYANTVSGGSLANIDAIRIVAQARRRPETGGVDDVTFGWAVNVFLRNGG
jgi:hypothetical protein